MLKTGGLDPGPGGAIPLSLPAAVWTPRVCCTSDSTPERDVRQWPDSRDRYPRPLPGREWHRDGGAGQLYTWGGGGTMGPTLRDKAPVRRSVLPVGRWRFRPAESHPTGCPRRLVKSRPGLVNRALASFGVKLPLRVTRGRSRISRPAPGRLTRPTDSDLDLDWFGSHHFYGFPTFGEAGPRRALGRQAGRKSRPIPPLTGPSRAAAGPRFLGNDHSLGRSIIYRHKDLPLHPDAGPRFRHRRRPGASRGHGRHRRGPWFQVRVAGRPDPLRSGGGWSHRRDLTPFRVDVDSSSPIPATNHGVTVSATLEAAAPRLRRAMGFRDLFLFYLITGFSVRWISNAAAAGPSAVIIWLTACRGLALVPLVFTVLELSSRYPEEGGIYVWSKRAFRGFQGIHHRLVYWTLSLPYFPSLL